MDNSNIEILVHHGIFGMKWGVRRYRNKDGSLTSAGKIKETKLRAQLKLLDAKKEDNDISKKSSSGSTTSPVKKSNLEELDDIQLQKAVSRLDLEKRYKEHSNTDLKVAKENVQLRKDYRDLYNQLNPPKPNRAKAYLKKLGDNLTDELGKLAAVKSKDMTEKLINKVLGVKEDPESYENLSKEYKYELVKYNLANLRKKTSPK